MPNRPMLDSGVAPAKGPAPARPFGKVVVLITEDWFCLSHFQPLVRLLASELATEVVVATRLSGREGEIRGLGARIVPFDLKRASLNPVEQAHTVARIARLIRAERPDVVHVIAMQPMVLACLAQAMIPAPPALLLHLTGLGFLGISTSRAIGLVRPAALAVLARALRRPASHLIAENPDDVAWLAERGVDAAGRVTIVGGAGLDPADWPPAPMPQNPRPVAAFVGRLIRSKGVEHLVAAQRLLHAQGLALDVALYGKIDPDNPDALPAETVAAWTTRPGVAWHGHVADVRRVWREADIAVLPAITREGLPRAVLEAAASARPLVVTDVPGCRHVVRDGIDGFVVPPGDPIALADALGRLATDRDLRERTGEAARERFLAGFTVDHVMEGVRGAYLALDRAQGDRRRPLQPAKPIMRGWMKALRSAMHRSRP